MTEIVIENVEADSNVLRSEISFSPELRRFFRGDDLFTEYSVDISDVPESVLAIPVLTQVCPVAWMQNADVYTPVLDSTLSESLGQVREALKQMYPSLIQGGDIHYRELAEGESGEKSGESGIFFTGGVDSMFSFVRHREESPSLINVQGWTVSIDDSETWNEVKEYVEGVATDHGVDALFVRSNMLRFLRNPMLIAYSEPHVTGAWYSSVGHGLGLPGLCAPLAYATGISDLYLSPSHWEGISQPYGTQPDVVENVQWSEADVHLEGYEYSRQERLEKIAEYVKAENSDLTLVTCTEKVSENCGRCEKCCRTSVGLLLAGLDPNDHGYRFDSETFEYIQNRLQNGDWGFRKDEHVHHWEDLQDHASIEETPFEGSQEFLRWLCEADFEAYADREQTPIENRLLFPLYRTIPWRIFNVLDSVTSTGPF